MNDSSSTRKDDDKIFEPYTEIYFKHNSRLILLTREFFGAQFLGSQTSVTISKMFRRLRCRRKAHYYDTDRPSKAFNTLDRKIFSEKCNVFTSKNLSLICLNRTSPAGISFAFLDVVFP